MSHLRHEIVRRVVSAVGGSEGDGGEVGEDGDSWSCTMRRVLHLPHDFRLMSRVQGMSFMILLWQAEERVHSIIIK